MVFNMKSDSNIKCLEQGRAKFAYICAIEGSKSSKPNDYKPYVKKIPMLIKTNGVGETFAFVNSKKSNEAYRLIYDQTTKWIIKDDKRLFDMKEGDDLVEKIISLDSTQYRAVTNEIMAFFNWLRRFVDGLIEGDS